VGPEVRALFDAPQDVERWSTWARHAEMAVERLEYRGGAEPEAETPAAAAQGSRWVFLTLRRRGRPAAPMSPELRPQPGDVASVAIYLPQHAEVLSQLAARGWMPLPAAEPALETAST
jgi:hypothetical protein